MGLRSPTPDHTAIRPTPPPSDEPGLVRLAQRGSREAAAELFRRHHPAARRAALAITGGGAAADDVTQDAFARAFEGIRRVDPDRPFAAWLHRIVVNRALDHLRAERRLVGLDAVPDGALAVDDAHDLPDRALLAALARIPAERRAVIVLRYLLDHEPREIAPLLGLPVGTVNSRLARGLADLRALMEDPG